MVAGQAGDHPWGRGVGVADEPRNAEVLSRAVLHVADDDRFGIAPHRLRFGEVIHPCDDRGGHLAVAAEVIVERAAGQVTDDGEAVVGSVRRDA